MSFNSFKTFLVEEEKTAFFTFGRMNPPTIGHEKLLNSLAMKAGKNPYRVFLSQSEDPKKNPLKFTDKVKIARKSFPKYARSIMLNRKVKNVFDVATTLHNEGFKNIVMVVGSDRVREFDILLNKYNGKRGKHGFYNFQRINVMSAGDRDPDADGVSGMSASKMRSAAADNDFTKFSQGLPKAIANAEAKKIFNAVRKGMGLKEENEFKKHIQFQPVSEIRENYVNGMLYNVGDTVINKDTGEVSEIKRLGSNYVIIEGSGNVYRKWLDDIEHVREEIKVADFSVKRKDQGLSESNDYLPDWGTTASRKWAERMTPGQRKDEGAAYHKGLSKSTMAKRKAHFKKGAKMDDDNPAAYKPAPGDAQAKTKTSKHTIRFRQMYGEKNSQVDIAKARIDREKESDKKKHDRMMDRARMRDVKKTNRES